MANFFHLEFLFRQNVMDSLLVDIADYIHAKEINSELAYDTARYCLMDSLGCGFLALACPQCRKMLGPIVPGASMPGGCRVPGTSLELDPDTEEVTAAFTPEGLAFFRAWLRRRGIDPVMSTS